MKQSERYLQRLPEGRNLRVETLEIASSHEDVEG
jgi:hypothetical protein